MQQVTQQSCPKCHRLIQSQRLSLHVHMCSTMQLRRSKIFSPKQQIQDKNTNCICIFCGIKLQTFEMEMHIANCQYRLVDCKICGKMFSFSVIDKHQDLCLSRQLKSAKLESERSEQKKQSSMRKEVDKQNDSGAIQKSSQFSFNSLNYGLQIIGSRLMSQGSKLAERCNAFLQQNKQPALESLKKLKQHLFNKMEDIFAFIVADPNTEGLPPTKIRQITQGQYSAKKNGQQQQICAICICDFQDEESIKILHCQHIFHPLCIDKWMKINKRCPLCNNDQLKGSK